MTLTKVAMIGITALALALGACSAARADLVLNGGFEMTTNGNGQLGLNTNATDWTTSGYNFLFASGTADTTGSNGQGGNVKLWGPGTGSANGLPASSPAAGNFVAADGDFGQGAITQTINGLTAGNTYQLGFYWAGAQQTVATGASADQWQVSLGSQTQSTAVVNNASEGFTGWMFQTMTFTATGPSEVLSFLAVSTPAGVPPFVLLDGVSLNPTSVPEPGSMLLLGAGLLAAGVVHRLRRRARSARV
jgi:hypothetical protein